jgi:hypothetical protein
MTGVSLVDHLSFRTLSSEEGKKLISVKEPERSGTGVAHLADTRFIIFTGNSV